MGRVAIVPNNAPRGIINQALLKLTPKDELLPHYLKLWMESENFQHSLNANVQGAAIVNVASVKVLKEIRIPLPSLDSQDRILSQIRKEQAMVNASRQLIEMYEKKISVRIAKVWGGNINTISS
jgi:type I restriction enzyme S subunit